jgi:glycosyltransferase involved in cell wall biosynthesis
VHLAIYCDYPYRVDQGRLYAEQPVALFLAELRRHVDRVTMIGRLDPTPGRFPYEIKGCEFVALPHYSSGASAVGVARSLPSSARRYWRALGDVDVAWVLGPTPLSLLFAIVTLARGRRLVLGVRQDLPRLFAHRYPDRRALRAGAALLEACFRSLALRVPTAVVGPALAHNYRHSRRLHTMYVSLLSESDLTGPETDGRDYGARQLQILSVGRLDPEKNPLLLADILADAVATEPRWHLDICGDGPLSDALAQRLGQLGVAGNSTLHGHVPIDDGLLEMYRSSHVFLHVSFTEGVPQVLLEAFAARLPVVATAVGGVSDLVADAGLLVGPDDAGAAARQLQRIATDPELRTALVARGTERVALHTREAEAARVASFLIDSAR